MIKMAGLARHPFFQHLDPARILLFFASFHPLFLAREREDLIEIICKLLSYFRR